MSFNKKMIEGFFERLGYADDFKEKGRKTFDALRSRYNKLLKELEASKNYQPGDEIHIVTIVMCEEIQMRSFLDVMNKGTLMTVDSEGKVQQKNHSISTFYQTSKLILETSKKLGLSALDRKELNIEQKTEDGMND